MDRPERGARRPPRVRRRSFDARAAPSYDASGAIGEAERGRKEPEEPLRYPLRTQSVRPLSLLVIPVLAWLVAGCSGGGEESYGGEIDGAKSMTVAEAIATIRVDARDAATDEAGGGDASATDEAGGDEAEVVIRGRIGAVCRSSGCWFVIEGEAGDGSNAIPASLRVDLDAAADFRVPPTIQGRDALVRGRLHGAPPDTELRGTALVLLP